MSVLVFGHKSPDTDSTGAPIIWAWYLNHILKTDAEPVLLGKPNSEALFMLDYWGIDMPRIIDELDNESSVVVVDTNNPDELPDNINKCDILSIIDHHKLVGGLETSYPIDVIIRPLACTATVMIEIIGENSKEIIYSQKKLIVNKFKKHKFAVYSFYFLALLYIITTLSFIDN